MGTREKRLGSLPSSNWGWEAGSRQPPTSCSLQYLPDPAAVYQSIDFISKALRMLNRWEDSLWGKQEKKTGAGRKPSGTFAWMVWHHSLDWKVKLLSLQGVRSWQWKGSGALSSFAGFLFIKQLLCARHPSWVLGTQRYAVYPLHIWELAHRPTKWTTENAVLQGW